MKKIGFLFLGLAFILCAPHAGAAPAKEKISYPSHDCGGKESIKPFLISGFKSYPPFSWKELAEEKSNATGLQIYRYNGFILDFVKAALNNIQVDRIKDAFFDNFQQTQKAVLHGKTDMFFTSYYLDESKSGSDYVYPAYFGNPFIVVSRASKKIDVSDISELKGLKGVIRQEEEIESLISGMLPTDTKLEVVEGAETAFRKLLSGDADFMITSPYAAEAEARRFKIKDKLHYGTKVLRHIKYFIAFSKLSACRKYKPLFAQQFEEQIKDKPAVEKKLQAYIRMWAEKFANEQPLQYTPPEGE